MRYRFLLSIVAILFVLIGLGPIFCSKATIWKYAFPLRSLLCRDFFLNSDSVGKSAIELCELYGRPDFDDGAYSWWSPLYGKSGDDLSSLVIRYDVNLNVVDILCRDSKDSDVAPLNFDIDEYKSGSPVVRHRMHVWLAQSALTGTIPLEINTIQEVEAVFTRAAFVHNWVYRGGINGGSFKIRFDKRNVAIELLEDW
ncbi:MAG: hypothetical protein SGI77_17355 [Pirellulaceae bacterium]|nr:hypothetical protein [Pirellulaceae bacterium]